MKTNKFAIYNKEKFYCGTSKGGKEINLYSDKQLAGFVETFEPGLYTKSVPRSECERVWGQQLTFNYNGQNFNVGGKKDGKVLLRTCSLYEDLDKQGFVSIGHGEYGKWVNETDGEEEWVITEY